MLQTSFDSRFPVGYPGMPAEVSPTHDRSYVNTALNVAGIVTVTVATFVANTEYSVTINGVVVSYRTPATGSSATLTRDALVAAVNQSFAGVDALAAAGNTFTITGTSGQPLSVAPGSVNLTTAATTDVTSSGNIGLGLAVVRLSTDTEREVRLGALTSDHYFVGVTLDDNLRTISISASQSSPPVYRQNDSMLVRELGTVWVALDAPVTVNSPVFYRYSGAGKIGGFRGVSATGANRQLTNAKFLTAGTSIAKLLLNYSFAVAAGTTV